VIAQEIQVWRRTLRQQLIERRSALSRATLDAYRRCIDAHLQRAFPDLDRGVIAFCWPYKNEYDARHLLAALRRRGATTALPAIIAPKTALVFREWHPGIALEAGPLGIPFPPDSAEVRPDSVLLPVVGFDAAGYRLGYGGGYFDRTLAAMPRPRVIAVAYEFMLIETIHPQPHDIPVDYVVTERGVYVRRENGGLRFSEVPAPACSSPPCRAAQLTANCFGKTPEGKPGR